MTPLGFKRKDIYGGTESPATPDKNYDDQEVYPEIRVSGKHALAMGAADLKPGAEIETKVKLRVADLTATDKNGKKSYSMTLEVCEIGDLECEDEEEDKGEDEMSEEQKKMSAMIAGHE